MDHPDTFPSGTRSAPKRILSEDLRRRAAQHFSEGLGTVATAKTLGLSVNTVRDWHRAYRAGRFRIESPEIVKCWDDETKERAIALRMSGLSWVDFEKKTGIPRATCIKWLRSR